MPAYFLRAVKKEEGREVIRKWSGQRSGLSSTEAPCGWRTLCTPRLSHLGAGRCFAHPRQRAPPPSGHLRQSRLLLGSSLCWMDFTQCREEGQDSSSFSLKLKKKKNSNCHHFLKILIVFPPQKGFFFLKYHLKDLFTLNMFRDFFF